MQQETLRRVPLSMLRIAKEVKRVCELLDIDYILDSGTLLGAVRQGGFIPWDDDLDLGMTQENYDRFLREAPGVFGEEYFLQTWHSDPHYGLPFAKVRLRGTLYVEESSEHAGAANGIYVDIFPYDVYPSGTKERRMQGRMFDLGRRLILAKCDYSPWEAGISSLIKEIVYRGLKIAVLPMSREKLITIFENACIRYNRQPTGFLFPCGTDNYGTAIFESRYLTELAPIVFENEMFLGPKDWNAYLRDYYGDYMTLPPEDQRENRHRIVKLSFGEPAVFEETGGEG